MGSHPREMECRRLTSSWLCGIVKVQRQRCQISTKQSVAEQDQNYHSLRKPKIRQRIVPQSQQPQRTATRTRQVFKYGRSRLRRSDNYVAGMGSREDLRINWSTPHFFNAFSGSFAKALHHSFTALPSVLFISSFTSSVSCYSSSQ